jgi:hypothetical protein
MKARHDETPVHALADPGNPQGEAVEATHVSGPPEEATCVVLFLAQKET